MWSISIGSLWVGQPALAATSSHPPQWAFHLLKSRVTELNRLADEGTSDDIFQEKAGEAIGYYRQLEVAQSLPQGSAQADTLLGLLQNERTVSDGLSQLNNVVADLNETISSLPAVSPMAPEIRTVDEGDDDIRDRPSWVGKFEMSMAGAQEALRTQMAKPEEEARIENRQRNILATKLWNRQWLESQKEVMNPGVSVERGELVSRDAVRVDAYGHALAVAGMASESALAILDDGRHRHLLGHISSSMPQERLNDAIRNAFPNLAMKRIYILPGGALAKESIVRILSALQAVGVTRLESTVRLLIPPRGAQYPSLLLYEGELYSKPEHFFSR